MERVLILGSPGSGKSLLARRMAAATGLPVVHLDRYFWRPGWVETPATVWRARLTALLEAPRWIMDGNYADSLDLRLARADTAIIVECSVWLCLIRVLRRAVLSFGRTRGEDMSPGCPERIDWPFLVYVWRFRRDQRPRVTEALRGFEGRVVVLRGEQEAAAFLASLGPTG